MTKILFIGKDFYPDTLGVSKYSTEMCMWLSNKSKFQLDVITGHPYYPEWISKRIGSPFIYVKERLQKINVIRVPTYIPSNPTGARRSLQNIVFSIFTLPIILYKIIYNIILFQF